MQCHKTQRLSRRAAQAVVDRARIRRALGNRNRRETRVYFCQEHRTYHTTSAGAPR